MRMTYWFGLFDFGGGADEVFYLTGPKGKKGKLVDYGIQHVLEAFNAPTTAAIVSVGSSSDLDAYGANLSIGALAADAGGKSVRTECVGDQIDDYILAAGLSMPKDTKVGVKCTAVTGSGPTGQAHVFAVIDWED